MTASQLPLDTPVSDAPVGDAPVTDEEDPRRRRKVLLLLLLLGTLILLIILAIWYLLFRQPIMPTLPGIPEAAMPAYSTSIYGVQGPIGVASTPSGDRVYVTQSEGEIGVLMFDGSGAKVGTFELPDTANHLFLYPAIDPLTGEVYVSDRPTGSIWIYDANGTFQRKYEPAKPIAGWQPVALAFDPAGNFYVTDFSGAAQQVEVFDRDANLVRTFGAEAGMTFPNGVSIGADGKAYVTDSNNGRLLVFDQSGVIVGRIGRGAGEGNLGMPRGVAATSDRVYVVDTPGHGVSAYRPLAPDQTSPAFVGFFGGEGITDGRFEFPNGIAADGRGRIYVADSANNRVQVWSY